MANPTVAMGAAIITKLKMVILALLMKRLRVAFGDCTFKISVAKLATLIKTVLTKLKMEKTKVALVVAVITKLKTANPFVATVVAIITKLMMVRFALLMEKLRVAIWGCTFRISVAKLATQKKAVITKLMTEKTKVARCVAIKTKLKMANPIVETRVAVITKLMMANPIVATGVAIITKHMMVRLALLMENLKVAIWGCTFRRSVAKLATQ